VKFKKNFFQLLFLFLLLTALFFSVTIAVKVNNIIQLLLQLQLTATYFSVIFLFQLQLQLTEGTLAGRLSDGLTIHSFCNCLEKPERIFARVSWCALCKNRSFSLTISFVNFYLNMIFKES